MQPSSTSFENVKMQKKKKKKHKLMLTLKIHITCHSTSDTRIDSLRIWEDFPESKRLTGTCWLNL